MKPPASRGGRPPLDRDDRSVNVHFRLPAKEYDALYAQASRERVSIGDVIRRRLRAPESGIDGQDT